MQCIYAHEMCWAHPELQPGQTTVIEPMEGALRRQPGEVNALVSGTPTAKVGDVITMMILPMRGFQATVVDARPDGSVAVELIGAKRWFTAGDWVPANSEPATPVESTPVVQVSGVNGMIRAMLAYRVQVGLRKHAGQRDVARAYIGGVDDMLCHAIQVAYGWDEVTSADWVVEELADIHASMAD